jgi:hypothetical protein
MVTDICSESILEGGHVGDFDGDVRSRWTWRKNIKWVLEKGLFSY